MTEAESIDSASVLVCVIQILIYRCGQLLCAAWTKLWLSFLESLHFKVRAFVARRNGRNLLAYEAYFLFLVLFLFVTCKNQMLNQF